MLCLFQVSKGLPAPHVPAVFPDMQATLGSSSSGIAFPICPGKLIVLSLPKLVEG